jgi:hypothetical protein
VIPSVRNQPLEEGDAKLKNAARFQKQTDGLYVILVPIDNPEAYWKIDDGDGGDEARMDEL